ncbi:hypothetical protein D3C73_1148300 [compost metagenome]
MAVLVTGAVVKVHVVAAESLPALSLNTPLGIETLYVLFGSSCLLAHFNSNWVELPINPELPTDNTVNGVLESVGVIVMSPLCGVIVVAKFSLIVEAILTFVSPAAGDVVMLISLAA